MHKLWGGRPLSEFKTGPDGEAACRFVARFARPGGGGWAAYKKRLERQHTGAALQSRSACELVEKSGAALPSQMARIDAATCGAPRQAHVRFSTAEP